MTNAAATYTQGNLHTKLLQMCLTEDWAKQNKIFNAPFLEAINSLIFVTMRVSRPNIALSESKVSQFMDISGPAHWKAVRRIFHSLIGTVNFGMQYKTSDIRHQI